MSETILEPSELPPINSNALEDDDDLHLDDDNGEPEASEEDPIASSVVPCGKPNCARYAVMSTKGHKQFCCKHIRSSGQTPKIFLSCQYPDCTKLVQPTTNEIRVFCQQHLRQQNLKFSAPSCKHHGCKTKAMTDSSGQTQYCTKHMQAYGLEPRRNRNIKVCGHAGCSARAKQSVGGKTEYCATHMYEHGMLPKAWESRMDWLPQYGLEAPVMEEEQTMAKRLRSSSAALPALPIPNNSSAAGGSAAANGAHQAGTSNGVDGAAGPSNGGAIGKDPEIPGKTVMVGLSTKGGSMEEADELARKHQESAARLKELLEVDRTLAAETTSCQLQHMQLPMGPIYLLFYNNPDMLNVEGSTALAHYVRCTAHSLEVGVIYANNNRVLETRIAADFALEKEVRYEEIVVHDIAPGLLVVEVPMVAA